MHLCILNYVNDPLFELSWLIRLSHLKNYPDLKGLAEYFTFRNRVKMADQFADILLIFFRIFHRVLN